VPHEPSTVAPPGTARPAGAAGLAGATSPAGAVGPAWCDRPCRCGRTCPAPRLRSESRSSRVHNFDEQDLSRQCRFDRMDEVVITWINGSTSPPINHHNRHSKAILSVPERRRFIPRHRGGPAAPPNHRAD
jgi:hypothetical protein